MKHLETAVELEENLNKWGEMQMFPYKAWWESCTMAAIIKTPNEGIASGKTVFIPQIERERLLT